ncbi:MAG: 3-deoxy-D-manno-octulosonic acid transferase [Alphaproteobacteria bacterium]|nr:3-deoxy-D-manno-octulosonic acid transferase [Alphaproteobacteria bacterium]
MSIWQSLYRLGTGAGAPLVSLLLQQRLRRGREDPARVAERRGQASAPRPPGALVWCHAASVGEMMSVLLLLEKLGEDLPEAHFLLTTGTVTSAAVVAGRLPPRTVHQYIPVDRIAFVRRFLDHWKPDAALWVESELWPNLLAEARAREIPAALINARMSARSLRRWGAMRGWIAQLLSTFRLCLTQTEAAVAAFEELGAPRVQYGGNLKYATIPLPYDEGKLELLREQVGPRPVWLMASSHPGEEETAIAAHKALAAKFPDLLTIIVPRHPARGEAIAALLAQNGLPFARRSAGALPGRETGVYLADTLGELGLFYRLVPVVFIGGTFAQVGGHNPIEPAWLESAIICGPDMTNFSEVIAQMKHAGAALQIEAPEALHRALQHLLSDGEKRAQMAQGALRVAQNNQDVLDRVIEMLRPVLPEAGRGV